MSARHNSRPASPHPKCCIKELFLFPKKLFYVGGPGRDDNFRFITLLFFSLYTLYRDKSIYINGRRRTVCVVCRASITILAIPAVRSPLRMNSILTCLWFISLSNSIRNKSGAPAGFNNKKRCYGQENCGYWSPYTHKREAKREVTRPILYIFKSTGLSLDRNGPLRALLSYSSSSCFMRPSKKITQSLYHMDTVQVVILLQVMIHIQKLEILNRIANQAYILLDY